jgi:uncharacterized protein (DUF983 family)
MSTSSHCPGFIELKHLKTFACKCPRCGKEKDIFSDELHRIHRCAACGKEIDYFQCSLSGEA